MRYFHGKCGSPIYLAVNEASTLSPKLHHDNAHVLEQVPECAKLAQEAIDSGMCVVIGLQVGCVAAILQVESCQILAC